MAQSPIKVGIIGAGSIVRHRHLPNLLAIPGVEVKVVCNRHIQTASEVKRDFNLPEATDDWRSVINRSDIDVVWIGTHPHMHAEITLAALHAGKHVFCQARMARNVDEARRMLASAQLHADRVTMLCPPPNGMKHGTFFRELIDRKEIGSLYHFNLRSFTAVWADRGAAAHWRQKIEVSGNNILSVGIYAEVLGWLLGDAVKLCAQGRVCIPKRGEYSVEIPDVVQVIGRWPGELEGTLQWSGVAQFAGNDALEVFGSLGTLKYDFSTDEIWIGRSDTNESTRVPVPTEYVRQWTVEEDFVRAVREGGRPEPSFETGVRYMRFVDAVTASMRNEAWVELDTI